MTERAFLELSIDDAPKIAAAIPQLARIGLKPLVPEQEFLEVAERKAEEWQGVGIPDPPLPSTWVHFALMGSEQIFANAVHYQDHCFDGAGEGDYAEIVASIMALAGEEWPSASVSATSVTREGRYRPSQRVEITISGEGGCAPFELVVDKDFDWSVVTRLNERLPPRASGRFAAFFDGNATIVYLRPDQLEELGRVFGYDFVSEVGPLVERPPLRSHDNPPLHNPLPFWPMLITSLMGIYAASELVGMIWRGSPYTLSSRNLTPISFVSAPLEFTLVVAIHLIGAVFFLGVPLYLAVRRARHARTPPRGGSTTT